jgi:hypothetical protein
MTMPTYVGIEAICERAYLAMNNMGGSKIWGETFEPLEDGPMYRKVFKLALNELTKIGNASPVDWTTVGAFTNDYVPNALRDSITTAVVGVVFPQFNPVLPKVHDTVKFEVVQLLSQVLSNVLAWNLGTGPQQIAANVSALNDQANAA